MMDSQGAMKTAWVAGHLANQLAELMTAHAAIQTTLSVKKLCNIILVFFYDVVNYFLLQCSPFNSDSLISEILFIQTGDYGPC